MGSTTSTSPVLLRGAVDNHLRGCHGMNRGHQRFFNAKLIMDGFHHWCQTVGCARSARNVSHVRSIFLLIDTHDDGRRLVLCRCREDNLLYTAINVGLGTFRGQESTSRFTQVFNTEILPRDFAWVAEMSRLHSLAIDDQIIPLNFYRSLPTTVNSVILELIGHVVRISSSVDSQKIRVGIFNHNSGDEATNTSEAINTKRIAHGQGAAIDSAWAGGKSCKRKGVRPAVAVC